MVISPRQTQGRGRSGAEWVTAPRALAASLAFNVDPVESRPISLMAGVAVSRSLSEVRLKWPNDVVLDDAKVGGILVERSDGTVVVGLGLNLCWPDPPGGAGAVYSSDPGQDHHVELGALWAAELMAMIDGEAWPLDEYREVCTTLGREITWEPAGHGRAVDVGDTGELVVESDSGRASILSGVVSHVRG